MDMKIGRIVIKIGYTISHDGIYCSVRNTFIEIPIDTEDDVLPITGAIGYLGKYFSCRLRSATRLKLPNNG